MPATAKPFWRAGIAVVPGFLSGAECATVLASVEDYRVSHHLPVVHR
ncbi:MAG: hypothetical protein QOD72_169, partial [Acidimicrobiaceae bacterium]|nr:hypothetical protein [Acidimicrobiaceae bacterium]